MSAGAFVTSRYELDGGQIVPVRVQPETLEFTDGTNANDPPAGAINLSLFAKTRKGNREYGIGCRLVTISWNAAPPAGYEDENLTIPVMTPANFANYATGTVVTYLGAPATIVGRKAENLR